MDYKVIRSNRKTISLQVRNGDLLVRAPDWLSDEEIQNFVLKHKNWIEKHSIREQEPFERLSAEEINVLAEKAVAVIPERVRHYAPLVGVTYGKITIRNQKTRWGSCSAKGNLNFNCLLMLTPPEVIDSIVVHELCHRKEMNHSEKFYAEILRVYPDYWKWNRWLKENGRKLIGRMTGE